MEETNHNSRLFSHPAFTSEVNNQTDSFVAGSYSRDPTHQDHDVVTASHQLE